MRGFVKRVTDKISKLTPEQIQRLFDVLNDEAELLDAVFESLSTGLIVCDSHWQPVMVNKTAQLYIPLRLQCPSSVPVWARILPFQVPGAQCVLYTLRFFPWCVPKRLPATLFKSTI